MVEAPMNMSHGKDGDFQDLFVAIEKAVEMPSVESPGQCAEWVSQVKTIPEYLRYLLEVYRRDPGFVLRDILIQNENLRRNENESWEANIVQLTPEQEQIRQALYPTVRESMVLASTSNNSRISCDLSKCQNPAEDIEQLLSSLGISLSGNPIRASDGSFSYVFSSNRSSRALLSDRTSVKKTHRLKEQYNFLLMMSGGQPGRFSDNKRHQEEFLKILKDVSEKSEHVRVSFVSGNRVSIDSLPQ